MVAAGISITILVLLVISFFLLGWIIPLVIGLTARGKNTPGYKPWIIFASIWGIGAVIVAVAGCVVIFFLQSFRGYGVSTAKASDFSVNSYKGETGRIKIDCEGESYLTAECGKLGQKRFAISNGTFTVPAGKVIVRGFEAVGKDKNNRKWTAQGRYYGEEKSNTLDVPAGEVKELKIGPPFKASIKVTFSAASDAISMNPVFIDNDGREYTVCGDDRNGTVPQFQLVDSENKVVMSGKFVFG